MALPASDNFNHPNGDPLGANWANGVGNFDIISNFARGLNGAGFSLAYWVPDSFSADQYSQCVTWYGANACGPAVRVDANGNGYVIIAGDATTNNAGIVLISGNGTANTTIGSTFSVAAFDTLKLVVIGTTLYAYRNGVLQDTVVDSTYATGQAGIFAYLGGAVDDFEADNMGGGGGVGQPTVKRWGGIPHTGSQKLRGGHRGGPWARHDSGIFVPRRFAA